MKRRKATRENCSTYPSEPAGVCIKVGEFTIWCDLPFGHSADEVDVTVSDSKGRLEIVEVKS